MGNTISTKERSYLSNVVLKVVTIGFALFAFMPVLFLIINSFKSQAEIIRNPLALPRE